MAPTDRPKILLSSLRGGDGNAGGSGSDGATDWEGGNPLGQDGGYPMLRSEHSDGGDFEDGTGNVAHAKWSQHTSLYPMSKGKYKDEPPHPMDGKKIMVLLYEPLAARYGVIAPMIKRAGKARRVQINMTDIVWEDSEVDGSKFKLFPGPMNDPAALADRPPQAIEMEKLGLDGIAESFNEQYRSNRSSLAENLVRDIFPKKAVLDSTARDEEFTKAHKKDPDVLLHGIPKALGRDQGQSFKRKGRTFNLTELMDQRHTLLQMKATQVAADKIDFTDVLNNLTRPERLDLFHHIQGCRIVMDMCLEDLKYERDSAIEDLEQMHPGLEDNLRLRAQRKCRRWWKHLRKHVPGKDLLSVLQKDIGLRANGPITDAALGFAPGTFGLGMDPQGNVETIIEPPAQTDHERIAGVLAPPTKTIHNLFAKPRISEKNWDGVSSEDLENKFEGTFLTMEDQSKFNQELAEFQDK
eukprot:CAMPEP_0114496822 /NCGR_PEP_ID=MMETSP0109-20121206/5978_1 /TAXON_ID=29199 /ORGANISM="Chlorarachnion reptans, Strain CCCM449" /LENGTH=466 /DNA_ID=CAMNT_0001674127 /DNA_START=261 /DNA_END=1662 /DNA_ORIENTATION=-